MALGNPVALKSSLAALAFNRQMLSGPIQQSSQDWIVYDNLKTKLFLNGIIISSTTMAFKSILPNPIQTYSNHNAKMIHQSAFAIHTSAPGTPDAVSSNGMLTSPLPLFLGGFLGSVMACAKCKDLVYELTKMKMIKGSEKSYHLMNC